MKCFFTDIEVNLINPEREGISYIVNGIQINLIDQEDKTKDIFQSKFFIDNKYLLKGVILNGKWPLKNDFIIQNEEDLQKILYESLYPKNPKEKLDDLLLNLYLIQGFDSDRINVEKYCYQSGRVFFFRFFRNERELLFYIKTLEKLGYVECHYPKHFTFPDKITLTFEGLNKAIELQEEGKHSKNCFIAMSFNDSEEIKGIRNAIKEVVEDLRFSPKIVDEVHFDSDKTINDAIVALIKQSKFAICDFTEQKDGVYFEAGYAAGRGIPVIYTCMEKDFKQSHFDTNHFPHIIYKTTDDLKEKLKNKIEAWIL